MGLRIVLGLLCLAIVVGWSGWIDVSGWPLSVPVVLEHCAIRYQGANVMVFYQGPGADNSCSTAASGWYRISGPPLGSVACYRQRFFGLSWKVYDTGLMLYATDVCNQLTSGTPPTYQSPGNNQPPAFVPVTTPTPIPTSTETPEQRAARVAQEQIDQAANSLTTQLADASSALDDYESMIGDMETDVADAQTALATMNSAYKKTFEVEVAKRPMDDNQQYQVSSALDDLDGDNYDVGTATDSVGWDDNDLYRPAVVDALAPIQAQIETLASLYAAHPDLRFSITPDAARTTLTQLSSRLADLDTRHDGAVSDAADLKQQGKDLWNTAKAEAKKVGVDY